MILLRLFFEFAKTGLFAVGGGLATIPFLQDLGARTGWFSAADLSTMIAVSESTPGAMGVNMATYVGFTIARLHGIPGIIGAIVATLGLTFPSIVVIVIIAGFLQKFRQSKTVEAVFYGLRPASTALIASAGLTVAMTVLVTLGDVISIHWPALILAVVVFVAMRYTPLKKLHPILFIAFFGIGYGAYYATADMPIPMVADCSDYETYRSGKYIPGIMGTLFSLVDKLVSSLSATVVGIAVSFVGLQSLPTQYDPYTPGMNWVVIVLFCIIPMVAWAATLIAMKGYTLTGAKMKEIQAVNACRRDAVAKGMKLEEAMDKWQTMDQLPAEYRN